MLKKQEMNYLIKERLVTAKLIDIRWERIHVFFEIRLTTYEEEMDLQSLDFYAVNDLHAAKTKLKLVRSDGDVFTFRTNITNNGENRCLPTGTYRLLACRGNDVLAECECDFAHPIPMSDKSREFIFLKDKGVCAVDFFIEDEEHRLPFRMRILLAYEKQFGFPPTAQNYGSFLKKLADPWKMVQLCYHLFRKFRGKSGKQTILFLTEQSDVLGANQQAVLNRMEERGLDKQFTILTSARPASAKTQSYKSWIDLVRKIARSQILILDDHVPLLDGLKLSDDTTVLQLWHAGAGFKSSGYSRWGHKSSPGPEGCHRQYSYGIAGSKQIAHFFSEVWGINDEQVLPTGMPRMDAFLDPAYRQETTQALYEKFPPCRGKKVILFAPTYRGRSKKTAHYPYDLIDFDRLYHLCGDEYVVLFKMHPWVSQPVPIPEAYRNKFLDVNRYPNINDLFYITDLLITDYSSNIFEYSLMGKPMLFFAFDKVQYSFSRGFHRDYEESAPGKVCYTFDQLMDALANKAFQHEKVKQYVEEHFDFIDSHASDRVIDWLILGKLPEEFRNDIRRVEEENLRMRSLDFTPPADPASEKQFH